jgi:four helix bundle protein
MIAARVEDLRAWQLTYRFKLAVYEIVRTSPIASDRDLRLQLRKSAASAVSQIEEGFARFYPKDFGRMVIGARASLKECCGHLRDAVDREYISPETLQDPSSTARDALKEMAGLIDYLQSSEAEENARRIRERRIARRQARKSKEQRRRPNPEHRTENAEPRTENPEPRTENPEPRTENPEPRTGNTEQRTGNTEQRTKNEEL